MQFLQTIQAGVQRRDSDAVKSGLESQSGAPAKAAEPGLAFTGLHGQTRIATSFGDVPVQLLRVRDMVRTREGNFVQVQNIEKISLDEDFLSYHPEAHPVRVRAGAFGPDRPRQDAVFAPGQKIQLDARSHVAEFRPAMTMANHPKVMRNPMTPLTYYVIDCGRPVTILAERIWIQI